MTVKLSDYRPYNFERLEAPVLDLSDSFTDILTLSVPVVAGTYELSSFILVEELGNVDAAEVQYTGDAASAIFRRDFASGNDDNWVATYVVPVVVAADGTFTTTLSARNITLAGTVNVVNANLVLKRVL